MKTAEVKGPVRPAPPMNSASKVWPTHNPNVIHIRSGSWANQGDLTMAKTAPTPVNQDVVVLVPAGLRAIVANTLVAQACEYPEHSKTYEDLTALATKVHELTVTGRAGHEPNLYDHVAKATGVPMADVKKVLLALSYAGEYLAPVGSNSPRTLAAQEAGKAISKALGRR